MQAIHLPSASPSPSLAGRVALVTGGGSGIGAATCALLASQGAAVCVVDFDRAGADAVAQAIQARGGIAMAVAADVRNPDAVEAAVDQAVQAWGGLHLAVNNAGVPSPQAAVADAALADWQRVIDINLTGVFLSLRAEIPAILASGGGAIVNLSSILGVRGMAGRAPYAATKHGVVGLTKSAALDYADRGIRINAVAPGYVETPLLKDRDASVKAALAAQHPLQRLAQPEEIAQTIAFLLSPQASFITGQTYLVDGGYAAQ